MDAPTAPAESKQTAVQINLRERQVTTMPNVAKPDFSQPPPIAKAASGPSVLADAKPAEAIPTAPKPAPPSRNSADHQSIRKLRGLKPDVINQINAHKGLSEPDRAYIAARIAAHPAAAVKVDVHISQNKNGDAAGHFAIKGIF